MYRGLAIGLVILFLASVAKFYHPGSGFTALIGFPQGHDYEAPAMRGVPHVDFPPEGSYDGQFYAQRALDPLLRDSATDRAMDLAPFRARRILFSWTAYAIGFGRPVWVIEAYALQNVACWLLLAALLTRWIPPTSGRGLALWAACLFSHGMLWSVRFALLDGPSVLLIAAAVSAVENGRPLLSAAILGISGLGRETNLAAIASQPIPRDWRQWTRLAAAIVICVLPLLVWGDYLWSIYRSTVFAGADQLGLPGAAFTRSLLAALATARRAPLFSPAARSFALLLSFAIQCAYLLVRRDYVKPWWRVAVGYAVLLLLLNSVLTDPATGAISRVLLPLTVGFNILLAAETRPGRFWPWFAAGNLHLLAGVLVMPLLPW